jgi:PAS domain-containing protein
VAEQQFEAYARPAVQELLLQARRSGLATEIQARLAGTHLSVGLLAMPLATSAGRRLLLRVRPAAPVVKEALPLHAALSHLVESTHDGILLTDLRGQLLGANRSFVSLVAAADEDQVRDRPLADWLGPTAADVADLLHAVRESGITPERRLTLHGADAASQAVLVSGALLIEGDQESLGFVLRPVPKG